MGANEAEAKRERLVGTVIQDRFLVLERLAAGGMGVVYKAEQVPLGRPVALKILDTKHDDVDGHFSERFFLEAATVAKLSHPNTIVLYDYGRTDEDLFYYAMEFVDGRTLTRHVYDEGPLPPAAGIHVALQICGSLREAHEAGMVHRDLKPANVMLTQKGGDPLFVKVLDFGLVKVVGQDAGIELTKSGMLMGSPRYMAPEQVTGTAVDHRADVYAFGAVMYHALVGAPPFRQDSQFEVLKAQVEQPPEPFRDVWPQCPVSERLEELVMRCLEKAPQDRPQSMNDVMGELAECAREVGMDDISISSSCRPLPSRRSGSDATSSTETSAPSRSSIRRTPAAGPLAATAYDRPSVRKKKEQQAAEEEAAAASTTPSSKGGGRRGLLMGAGLLAVAALVGAGWWMVSPGEPDPASLAEPSAEPTAAASPTEPAAIEADEASEAAEGSFAEVRIISEPSGAWVRRGDVDLGDAPLSLRIPDGERWSLTLSLDGYQPRTVRAGAARGELRVRLRPEPEEASARRTGGRRTPRAAGRRAAAGREPAASAQEAAEEAPEARQPSTSEGSSDTTGSTESVEPWRPPSSDNRDPWAE